MSTTQSLQFSLPALNDAEVYAGAIFSPDGRGNHVILLPETKADLTWSAAMEFAKSVGGDLPSRVELALLYAHSKQQFEPDWYWSNESYASSYAWCQHFSHGGQLTCRQYGELRARAVRRLVIE